MSTKKPLKNKKTDEAKEAYTLGVMTGAIFYARSMKHYTTPDKNPTLHRLATNIDIIDESYEDSKKYKAKRAKDWRIGNFVSPTSANFSGFFAHQNGLVKYIVTDTHPSGTSGIECVDGVLELAAWWVIGGIPTRDPAKLFVAADQWAVA